MTQNGHVHITMNFKNFGLPFLLFVEIKSASVT